MVKTSVKMAKHCHGSVEETGDETDVSPAAAGLLLKLRASVRRRVCSIPQRFSASQGKSLEEEPKGSAVLEVRGGAGNEDQQQTVSFGQDPSDSNDAETIPPSQLASGGGKRKGRAAVDAARVGVLFSGGLDSVVLAAMLAEAGGRGEGVSGEEGQASMAAAVPEGEAIDLINVCFDR